MGGETEPLDRLDPNVRAVRFVCSGNMVRSAFAELLARHLGCPLPVDSCATTYRNPAVHPETRAALLRAGVDAAACDRFRPRHVDDLPEDGVPRLVLGMTGEHLAAYRARHLLTELLVLDDDRAVQDFWQRMREEGRVDELIAAFEAHAAEAPGDPERQLQLGQAYLQKIQEVGNGPLAGELATRADRAFDAALAVDPDHWEARFHKAVALSFWPPVFGKQNAAIAQFEHLIGQQAGLAPAPEHAQVHLLLGNMYQQVGATEKALAAWKTGLSVFPDHEGLAAQLALVEGE